MSTRTTTVRTKYVPATDTTGSRYLVAEEGTRVQKRFPTDYAQRDMHEHAAIKFAVEILHYRAPRIRYADGRQPDRGFRFTITESD